MLSSVNGVLFWDFFCTEVLFHCFVHLPIHPIQWFSLFSPLSSFIAIATTPSTLPLLPIWKSIIQSFDHHYTQTNIVNPWTTTTTIRPPHSNHVSNSSFLTWCMTTGSETDQMIFVFDLILLNVPSNSPILQYIPTFFVPRVRTEQPIHDVGSKLVNLKKLHISSNLDLMKKNVSDTNDNNNNNRCGWFPIKLGQRAWDIFHFPSITIK